MVPLFVTPDFEKTLVGGVEGLGRCWKIGSAETGANLTRLSSCPFAAQAAGQIATMNRMGSRIKNRLAKALLLD